MKCCSANHFMRENNFDNSIERANDRLSQKPHESTSTHIFEFHLTNEDTPRTVQKDKSKFENNGKHV